MTGGRRIGRWPAVVLAVSLTACFQPSYPVGLVCSERQTCPPDQACGADGICAPASGPVDAAASDAVADGPASDGALIDAVIDPGADATIDAAVDPGADAGADATIDAAVDAPPPPCALVPTLAGPDPGVVTSGQYDASYPGWQAFDAVPTSMWISNTDQASVFIGYQWSDGPRTAVAYAIHYTNGGIVSRAPRAWLLQGWNGAMWSTHSAVTEQRNWGGGERRVFTIDNPTAYQGYRLWITEDNDDSTGASIVAISMGRLELLGASCSGTLAAAEDLR